MAKREPEQFTLDREDKLRIDLQGKIDKIDLKIETKASQLDQKIEQKVSNHVLYGAASILMLILGGVFGYAFNQISKSNDKIDSMNDRLTRFETKAEVSKPRHP